MNSKITLTFLKILIRTFDFACEGPLIDKQKGVFNFSASSDIVKD